MVGQIIRCNDDSRRLRTTKRSREDAASGTAQPWSRRYARYETRSPESLKACLLPLQTMQQSIGKRGRYATYLSAALAQLVPLNP